MRHVGALVENNQEIYGTLASGGSFRATPAVLELRAPTGEIAGSFDTRFFSSVVRDGQTLTIGRRGNSSINVTTGTMQEAEALERVLQSAPDAPVGAAATTTQTSQGSGGRGFLKWGCIGGLVFAGLLAVCVVVGLLLLPDDEDDEPALAASTVTATATSPPADEPTATSEPAVEVTETVPPAETSVAVQPLPSPTAQEVASTPTTVPEPEPTATPEPEPTIESEPDAVGAGRSNPVPLGQSGTTADGEWQAQVNQVVRGDEAWQMVLDANQFNRPPDEGMEYVVVNMTMTYVGTSPEAQSVGRFDFNTTGDARVRWSWASAVHPSPELGADLFTGGETTGWVVLQAREGETNLLAIYEPSVSFAEGDELFLALEEGAAVAPILDRLADENDLGVARDNPAPFGETVVVENWEISLTEVIRGEAAWEMVLDTNQFNNPPEEGMEYIAVRATVRNVKGGHGSDRINRFMFESTGSANVIHDRPSVVQPEPDLDFDLYAGGQVNGWVIVQARIGETNVSLVFSSRQFFGGETRYLALE